MLLAAVRYLNTSNNAYSEECDSSPSVSVNYVVIFLLLHVVDQNHQRSNNSDKYDAVWPSPNAEVESMSNRSSSPTNYTKRVNANLPSSPQSISLSPRSASRSPSSSSPKFSKSSAQQIQILKRKLFIILFCLSLEMHPANDFRADDIASEISALLTGQIKHTDIRNIVLPPINRKVVDCLKFFIAGAHSLDEMEVSNLSSLLPEWSISVVNHKEELSDNMESTFLPFDDVISWFENHIIYNEILYPNGVYDPSSPVSSQSTPSPLSSVASTSSSIPSSPSVFFPANTDVSLLNGSMFAKGSDEPQMLHGNIIHPSESATSSSRGFLHQACKKNPLRLIHNINSLSKKTPTLIHDVSMTTYVTVATVTSNDEQESKTTNSSLEEITMKELDLSDFLNRLPTLSITNVSKASMYLLSVYSSSCICSATDCDIVVGAVYGTVVLINCERVKLSICCYKLLLYNCIDCDLHVACLKPSLIFGDSRNLRFSPYNANYKHLPIHLKTAKLDSLGHSERNNQWCVLCDVNMCADIPTTAGSPSGYAIDTISEGIISLPIPTMTTASILPLDRFLFVTIPLHEENISYITSISSEGLGFGIPLPKQYREALNLRYRKSQQAKNMIKNLLLTSSISSIDNPENKMSDEENLMDYTTIVSPIVSKKFSVSYIMYSNNIILILLFVIRIGL